MERRDFIKLTLGGMILAALSPYIKIGKAFAAEAVSKLTLSNDEWKKKLTAAQYDILREEGTERPFTSPLLNEHRAGVFACVACGLELFPSNYKFESGTGWPSFFDAIPGHLETKSDYTLIMQRTEYHCARYQGPDHGTQYRSTIFYATPEQKQAAETKIAKLDAGHAFDAPIVTSLEPLKGFYPAEDYHQHYAQLHPLNPYILVNDRPKVDALKSKFPAYFVEQ